MQEYKKLAHVHISFGHIQWLSSKKSEQKRANIVHSLTTKEERESLPIEVYLYHSSGLMCYI